MRLRIAVVSFVASLIGLAAGHGVWDVKPSPTTTQTIYVRNISSYVSDKAVANTMPAFQAATTKDFAPLWNVDAKLVFIGHDKAPHGAQVIELLDKSDIEGALAYHGLNDGVPFAKVFVGTSKFYGYSWTVGFTHELWEMLADPSIVRTAQAPDGVIWAFENADPVEAEALGYTRPGSNGEPVLISDFVTEKWFGAETAGPFDFMNHVQKPLVVLPGGYAQYWNGTGWVVVDNFRRIVKERDEPEGLDVFWVRDS